jgi:hypothetical protein
MDVSMALALVGRMLGILNPERPVFESIARKLTNEI